MGIFDWSDKGNNKGLRAGEKKSPSGNGVGTWWSRSDGTSGQSQSNRNSDGSVTYWQHDRDGKGKESVTEVRYRTDGRTDISKKR